MKKPTVEEINKRINAFDADTTGYEMEEQVIRDMCSFVKMMGGDRLVEIAKLIKELTK